METILNSLCYWASRRELWGDCDYDVTFRMHNALQALIFVLKIHWKYMLPSENHKNPKSYPLVGFVFLILSGYCLIIRDIKFNFLVSLCCFFVSKFMAP